MKDMTYGRNLHIVLLQKFNVQVIWIAIAEVRLCKTLRKLYNVMKVTKSWNKNMELSRKQSMRTEYYSMANESLQSDITRYHIYQI